MKLRTDLHISRKIYHVLGLIIIISLYTLLKDLSIMGTSTNWATGAITIAMLIVVPFDYARIRFSRVNQTTLSFFKRVMRTNELDSLSAMSYLLMGSWLVISFFPAQIVYLSLCMLAIGDPMSSIIGVLYGKDKILRNKSLQGTLAGFVACSIVALIFYWSQNLMVERLILVSLISGMIGAVAELIPVGRIDDNFIFPVVSAVLLSGIFYVFGGFS